ncbi:glutamyl-tRNA reductase [Aeropyrum pernix]|uniref:Glutamyl-tRNA reductase n=1 Tax=Aeropyrum pernix TaxID=56636 RepID=A0A401H7E5_AERPX|nr:hypothetical protein [Aeropyrum pernix]GBF08324.1 glutamyl-tRNA reductase [Aeropyrum pernix]
MIDRLAMIGVNVKTSSREHVARLEKEWEKHLDTIGYASRGTVIIATCNRFEVYLDSPSRLVEDLASSIASPGGEGLVRLQGIEAARHLFRVASGLESQIIGDHEVLGQVRRAWLKSREKGFTTPLLDEVFHRALKTGARVRSETAISSGGVGYSSAAVSLAASLLGGGLDGARVGIVGAGMAAVGIARASCTRWRPRVVAVFNRTPERGWEVAGKCRGVESLVLPLDELAKLLNELDALFVAIAGSTNILERGRIERSVGPRVIVDISNPPVTPKVAGRVFHMPEVEEEARRMMEERLRWIPTAEAIIEEELEALLDALSRRRARESSRSVMRALSILAEREYERTLAGLRNGVDPREAVELALNSYTKKVGGALRRLLEEASDRGQLSLEDIEAILVSELARIAENSGFKNGSTR